MALQEGCFLQQQVKGPHHQDFEIEHVLNVVGKEGFEGLGVLAATIITPQEHGQKSVHTIEIIAIHIEAFFDGFETAGVAEGFEDIAQVDMGLGEAKAEGAFDEGEVEAFAVEGNEEGVALDVVGEGVEILAMDVVVDVLAIVEGDGGDVVAGAAEAGGFDVEVSGGGAEMAEEAPMVAGVQKLGKEGGVGFLQVLSGKGDKRF